MEGEGIVVGREKGKEREWRKLRRIGEGMGGRRLLEG